MNLPEDNFWDFYWEIHLQDMENLGKRDAILAASRVIRKLKEQNRRPLRLLELGCGEGQIIGSLVMGHPQECDQRASLGIDYNRRSLEVGGKNYPGLRLIEGDFTDSELLDGLGEFDIVLLVNALHEVFSACISNITDEVDVPLAKKQVETALERATKRLAPGGRLILFDGLEPSGDGEELIQIRFADAPTREEFFLFTRQYRPFHIQYQELQERYCLKISRHDFTRYIDKSIFLGKELWQNERFESYQYFTEDEFRDSFARCNLHIEEWQTFSVNEEKWRRKVEILSPGMDFPVEHILILAGRENEAAN